MPVARAAGNHAEHRHQNQHQAGPQLRFGSEDYGSFRRHTGYSAPESYRRAHAEIDAAQVEEDDAAHSAYAIGVDLHDSLKCAQVFTRQSETVFRLEQVDEGVLNVQDQRARGIQKLKLRNFAGALGDFDAALALAAAFQDEIGAQVVFSGTGGVAGIESVQEVDVVEAGGEHGVGTQLGGDDARVGDEEMVLFGEQIEVAIVTVADGREESNGGDEDREEAAPADLARAAPVEEAEEYESGDTNPEPAEVEGGGEGEGLRYIFRIA